VQVINLFLLIGSNNKWRTYSCILFFGLFTSYA